MPINIVDKSLFTQGYSLRYITGWDNLFKQERHPGKLKFCSLNQKYIVPVEILADRDKLREEDINIIVNSLHNSDEVEKLIRDNTNDIYEICRSSPSMEILLDLKSMSVIMDDDFTTFFPRYGLNTIFKFENVSVPYYYCLVNPTKEILDADFYAWLVSYIYSTVICLIPRTEIKPFAKVFLQAISLISSNGNGNKKVHVSKNPSILNCGLSDCEEYLYEIPGNTKRYEHLAESSMEQFYNKNRSKKNVL